MLRQAENEAWESHVRVKTKIEILQSRANYKTYSYKAMIDEIFVSVRTKKYIFRNRSFLCESLL